jgi:hypothetical protein
MGRLVHTAQRTPYDNRPRLVVSHSTYPPSFPQSPSPPHSLVRDGQTSPHRPRLVVSYSTCPPLSPSPHAHSFVLGTAVINNISVFSFPSSSEKSYHHPQRNHILLLLREVLLLLHFLCPSLSPLPSQHQPSFRSTTTSDWFSLFFICCFLTVSQEQTP